MWAPSCVPDFVFKSWEVTLPSERTDGTDAFAQRGVYLFPYLKPIPQHRETNVTLPPSSPTTLSDRCLPFINMPCTGRPPPTPRRCRRRRRR